MNVIKYLFHNVISELTE